ncbi:MAG: aromatic ring-hydroxylating dioxygenase subunit alpha [Actinomycetota bacterium]
MNVMTTIYPVDPGRALPAEAYRADSFAADVDHVFRRDWVFVGTADEVSEPGDYVTTELGGQPVIVQRDQDGRLGAISNLCAHRGTLLVEGYGNAKRFSCPYHGWTYADDGRLLAVPYTTRDDVDRSAHCLPRYRAEEWRGLVFASSTDDVQPLSERFAHLDELAADAGIDRLHHWTSQRSEAVWEANWKLVISNAMESYHLFKVHEETLEPYTPTAGAHYLVGSADGTATAGTSPDGDDVYTLLSLPPNFVGTITGGALLWQAVQPLAWDRTRVVTGAAYPSPPPDRSSGLSKLRGLATAAAGAMLPDFLPEDEEICRRGQRAASGDFAPGVLVPMEQVISDFHHYLARQLHGAPVPPVRTSAEVGIARRDRAVRA